MAPQSPPSKHQTEKPLRQIAAEKLHGKGSNPSQIGDPVSLKAEAADSHPTDQDLGSRSSNSEPQPPPNAAAGAPHSAANHKESNPKTSPGQGDPSSNTRTPPSSSGGSHEQKQLKGGRALRGMMEEKVSQVEKGGIEKSKKEPKDHDNGPSGSKGRAPTAKL